MIDLKAGMRLRNGNDIYIIVNLGDPDYRICNLNSGNRWNGVNWYGRTLEDLNKSIKYSTKFTIIEEETIKEDTMTKQYKLIKDFTPEELLKAGCPRDLFYKMMEYTGNKYLLFVFDLSGSNKLLNKNTILYSFIKDFFPWFIENGYIEVVTDDAEDTLTPGMILEEKDGCRLFVGVDYIYMLSGWGSANGYIYTKYTESLKDLNKGTITWYVVE